MSEELKNAETTEESKAEVNKDAEGQGSYHLMCTKCGHTWWSPYWDNYCPKYGCSGSARRIN